MAYSCSAILKIGKKMGRKDKISMPASTAGITRYFDDYKSKIEFKPEYIIILVVIVILIEIFLHVRGGLF